MENKKNIALEILEKEINNKEIQLKEIQKENYIKTQKIKESVLKEYKTLFESFIEEVDQGDVYLDASGDGNSIYFKKAVEYEKGKYTQKELFSIYLEKSNWDTREADKVRLSYYTTFCETEFEFDRVILLGKVAEVVKNNDQDLLKIHNSREKISYREVNQVEKEIRELKQTLREAKEEAQFYKFETEGFEFEEPTHVYTTNDYRVWGVTKMKLVKYTNKNQKTATINFVTKDGQEFDVDKVKISNIKPYIK